MNIENIKIESIQPNLSHNHILASLTIFFLEDNLKITGFRIFEKNNKRWLNPPSWGDNENGWHEIVRITNEKEWKELEKRAIEEYEKSQTKITPPDNSDIKPEEIPF